MTSFADQFCSASPTKSWNSLVVRIMEGKDVCSILAAILTAVPHAMNFGIFCPNTPQVTSPQCIPTLISNVSKSTAFWPTHASCIPPTPMGDGMLTFLASHTISLAIASARMAASLALLLSSSPSSFSNRLVAQMYASPIVSSFITPCKSQSSSKRANRFCSMSITLIGLISIDIRENPTISVNTIQTFLAFSAYKALVGDRSIPVV
mmetsp:Transcript_14302/g.29196  ORF Transcript_14302/g.29196 Transcript_14302/m.29196 type:complete len:207 (-) Transcript_14302:1578-2198(-)